VPEKIWTKWNINLLFQSTAQVAQSRFEYAQRDCPPSVIQIQKITVYDGKSPGESRTTFKIVSRSWPQYFPYYTKYDNRGRSRTYQRTTFHEYLVTISLDALSLATPVKLRTGSDKKWIFDPNPALIRTKNNPLAPYLSVGDFNAKTYGINADHFFTQSYNRYVSGCLFGRNYAKYAPKNYKIPFLMKHEINCLLQMMNRGYFTKE
jgi:hypothetical protein